MRAWLDRIWARRAAWRRRLRAFGGMVAAVLIIGLVVPPLPAAAAPGDIVDRLLADPISDAATGASAPPASIAKRMNEHSFYLDAPVRGAVGAIEGSGRAVANGLCAAAKILTFWLPTSPFPKSPCVPPK